MIKKVIIRVPSFSILFVLFLFSCSSSKQNSNSTSDAAWSAALKKIQLINEPVFQNNVFDITNYGAQGDGVFNNIDVFKNVIQLCSENGGGMVLVP